MKYLVQGGMGLGDTVIATPICEAIMRLGPDVQLDFLCRKDLLAMFAKAPYRVITEVTKDVEYDVHINFFYEDNPNVNAKKTIDLNHIWWGLESQKYVPDMFFETLNFRYEGITPKIYPVLHPTPQNVVTIGYNNQANWFMKLLSPDIETELIEGLLDRFGNVKIYVLKVSVRDFDATDNLFGDDRVQLVDVDIQEMMNLIVSCDMFISIDSGPMHLAAALGVPTVALFGPTCSRTWCPRGNHVTCLRPVIGQCLDCMRQQRDVGANNAECVKEKRCLDEFNPQRMVDDIAAFYAQQKGMP